MGATNLASLLTIKLVMWSKILTISIASKIDIKYILVLTQHQCGVNDFLLVLDVKSKILLLMSIPGYNSNSYFFFLTILIVICLVQNLLNAFLIIKIGLVQNLKVSTRGFTWA